MLFVFLRLTFYSLINISDNILESLAEATNKKEQNRKRKQNYLRNKKARKCMNRAVLKETTDIVVEQDDQGLTLANEECRKTYTDNVKKLLGEARTKILEYRHLQEGIPKDHFLESSTNFKKQFLNFRVLCFLAFNMIEKVAMEKFKYLTLGICFLKFLLVVIFLLSCCFFLKSNNDC